MDGGVWWTAVHGVAKSQTWLSNFTFTFHFHALEKEMATHSSVLAWRISGTREPGGLPSMRSHRVGHDWSDLAAAVASSFWATKNGIFWEIRGWKSSYLKRCSMQFQNGRSLEFDLQEDEDIDFMQREQQPKQRCRKSKEVFRTS